MPAPQAAHLERRPTSLTEDHTLPISLPARRRRLTALVAALLAFAGVAAFLANQATEAPAAANPNIYDCRGGIEKGEVDAETGETQVKYIFACNGPITGYQIQPSVEATGIETEVFGTDKVTKETIASDFFSCNGDIPGFGINCVGTYNGNYEVITGSFTIDGDICAEPRVDPLLTVMYATASGTPAKVTQGISGPYDLGRPRKSGCPATKFSGKTRIPREVPEDASASDVG